GPPRDGADSLFLSEDAGNTWMPRGLDLPPVSVNAVVFDPVQPDAMYAGTDLGVYRSVDAGSPWEAFDAGIPHVVITDLAADGARGTLYAATMGLGMYRVG